MELSGQFQARTALPPRKQLPGPLHRPQNRSRQFGEILVHIPGNEPQFFGYAAHSLLAVPTTR